MATRGTQRHGSAANVRSNAAATWVLRTTQRRRAPPGSIGWGGRALAPAPRRHRYRTPEPCCTALHRPASPPSASAVAAWRRDFVTSPREGVTPTDNPSSMKL